VDVRHDESGAEGPIQIIIIVIVRPMRHPAIVVGELAMNVVQQREITRLLAKLQEIERDVQNLLSEKYAEHEGVDEMNTETELLSDAAESLSSVIGGLRDIAARSES
jgi:hypothetical protein